MFTQKTKAVVLATLALPNCSGEERPPYAGDVVEDSQAAENDRDPITGEALIAIDEEASTGSCGLVDVELEVLRPNFYFLLDSSDSMQEEMPDSGGITRHLAARRAILDMLRVSGHRVNFGAAVFPDPSGGDGCSAGRAVFELRKGEPLLEDGSDNAALEALAFTLRKYSPQGATPVSSSLAALGGLFREAPTRTRLFLLTDGAPNCNAQSERCGADRCIANIEGLTVEGGPVCDESYNCCDELFPHLCLDDEQVVSELGSLAEDGIQSYVIGIPGSETYAEILNAMARAARTAQEGRDTEYYRVEDSDELALTLTTLGEQLSAACDFDLGRAPREVELVRVRIDRTLLELDDPNGFRWTGEQSIEILGEACSAWQQGDVSTVRVVEECTGVAR